MSIENGMRPEGAESFKAPADKPKQKKGIFQKIRSSKIARTLGMGAALGGGAMLMQEQARGESWADKVGKVGQTVTEMSRESNRHREEIIREQTRRTRDAQIHQEQMVREAARLEENRIREAARLKEEELRNNTERQRNVLGTLRETGAEELEADSVGNKTSAKIKKTGNTPEERMEAERHKHEEEMLKMKQEFVKNNPNLRNEVR